MTFECNFLTSRMCITSSFSGNPFIFQSLIYSMIDRSTNSYKDCASVPIWLYWSLLWFCYILTWNPVQLFSVPNYKVLFLCLYFRLIFWTLKYPYLGNLSNIFHLIQNAQKVEMDYWNKEDQGSQKLTLRNKKNRRDIRNWEIRQKY